MYTVADADLDRDRDAIERLWRRNFVHGTEGRYDWLYRDQRLGPASCMLLNSGGHELVGTNGLVPRTVSTGGKRVVVGQAVDLAIDRAHRAAGPALMLQRRIVRQAIERGMPMVYGFPMPGAEAVLRRVGYGELGEFVGWTKMLRCGPGTGRAGSGRPLEAAKRWARGMEDGYRRIRYRMPPGWHGAILAGFDERFDRLWAGAVRQFDVVGDRGSEFLRARFAGSPKQGLRIFGLSAADGKLQGYVVFRQEGGKLRVVDALASARPLWPALFMAFAGWARTERAERIDFAAVAPEWLADGLRRSGFRKRRSNGQRSNNRVMAFMHGANPRTGLFRNGAEWYVTHADSDAA